MASKYEWVVRISTVDSDEKVLGFTDYTVKNRSRAREIKNAYQVIHRDDSNVRVTLHRTKSIVMGDQETRFMTKVR